MANVTTLLYKTIKTLQNDGPAKVGEKAILYIQKKRQMRSESQNLDDCFRDVLFINGCDEHLPHPGRYRVTHQREQLESLGLTTGEVYFQNLSLDVLRCYNQFIIFRCPWTELLDEFVTEAKALNKTVFYDVDDLVIDTEYTDQIPYLSELSSEEREAYDENVQNMGRLLRMCDGAITTTEALAEELKKFVPCVCINRNTASEEMIKLSVEASQKQLQKNKNTKKTAKKQERLPVSLGYFSGSITHNDDFMMIMPVIQELMGKYQNLFLHIVGELTVPEELKLYEERIIRHDFVPWQKLPELIAQVDINLAPIRDTLFNRAKSENKWVEAALVQVPTIASDVGAFHTQIEQGTTGFLCKNQEEWKHTLKELIEQPILRKKTGKNAYSWCCGNCITSVTGYALRDFLNNNRHPNAAFILPAFQISGGVMVALQHARILRKHGRDVTLLSIDERGQEKWYEFEGIRFPVLNLTVSKCVGRMDTVTATMWSTVSWLSQLSGAALKGYLVQNYEPDFYQPGDPLRMQARKTYHAESDIHYLTISKWCEHWLRENYRQKVCYVPNGLEYARFSGSQRILSAKGSQMVDGSYRKIRILIEGDSTASHKRVDESFRIAGALNPDKYEIWYLAYHGSPKNWYHVDRFLENIPYQEVDRIYKECDILLKSSVLESFSYPPLEMMCSGGYVVAVKNEGNKEYLLNRINALCYTSGKVQEAVSCIEELISNQELQNCLYENGIKEAVQRDWKTLETEIIKLYTQNVEE